MKEWILSPYQSSDYSKENVKAEYILFVVMFLFPISVLVLLLEITLLSDIVSLSWIDTDAIFMGIANLINFFIILPLLRKGHIRTCSYLIILTFSLIIYGIAHPFTELASVILIALVLPNYMSALLLSFRKSLAVIFANLTIMLILPSFYPVSPVTFTISLIIYILTSPSLNYTNYIFGGLGAKFQRSLSNIEEESYKLIFEDAIDPIFIIDLSGDFVTYNQSLLELIEFEPEKQQALNLLNFIKDGNKAAIILEIIKQGRQIERFELELITMNGQSKVVEINATPHRGMEGQTIGCKGIMYDVTQRKLDEISEKETQQALMQTQKMEAIGRLAGGVAHDFNNTLTAIMGYSELLSLDFDEFDPRMLYVNEIISAGDRASALTQQLLAFSKRQVVKPEILNLNQILNDMMHIFKMIVKNPVILRTSLAEDLETVKIDRYQIQQAILNLVINSKDAIHSNGEIVITTSNVVTDDLDFERPDITEFVELSVSDTGMGMDENVQSNLFMPFFTTKSNGTGLGLSTTYGIIQQAGGSIVVESEVNEGSKFSIYLPVTEETITDIVEPLPSSIQTNPRTILIVEDEASVLSYTWLMLEKEGYRVIPASDPTSALSQFQANPSIDLVITDIVLPQMSGIDLYYEFKRLDPEINIIFMSGYSEDILETANEDLKDVPFIQKPFVKDDLISSIESFSHGFSQSND